MNSAVLSALSALAGSTIGAISSVATTWLAQVYQGRNQFLSQEISQRQQLFNDFINLASKLYADAMGHEAPEPSTIVPLYALKAQISLFAAKETIDRADQVMRRIIDAYYEPVENLRNREALKGREYDLLHAFTLAGRAELGVDSCSGTGSHRLRILSRLIRRQY
jgi:hypothetical protein